MSDQQLSSETKETTTSMWRYVPIFEKMSKKIKINSPANRPKHSRAKWMSNERHEVASKNRILFGTLKVVNH